MQEGTVTRVFRPNVTTDFGNVTAHFGDRDRRFGAPEGGARNPAALRRERNPGRPTLDGFLPSRSGMPKQRMSLRMIKDVIRLKWHAQLSHAQIATTLNISKGVVAKYVGLATATDLDWETVQGWSEQQLATSKETREEMRSCDMVGSVNRAGLPETETGTARRSAAVKVRRRSGRKRNAIARRP
jgi:hypothetical protein